MMMTGLDKNKLPPMKTLQGFEAAARLLSFRQAATELNLSHQAISNQVLMLENSLGQRLFLREGRQVQLTTFGRRLYPVVREALDNLVHCCEQIRNEGHEQPLRIHTYLTLSLRWLSSRLPHFRRRYPGIDVQLFSTIHEFGLDEGNADLGLLLRPDFIPAHLSWTPLSRFNLYPVCHPDLIDGAVRLPDPLALLEYPLIRISSEQWQWQDWFSALGYKNVHIPQPLTVNSTAVAMEMALNGEGITLIYDPVVDKELTERRLIRPVADCVDSIGHWGFIYRRDREQDRQIRSFITWLQADMAWQSSKPAVAGAENFSTAAGSDSFSL
jgi:LysR family transcriptional regulator, glycine cleavage system transcriptional activator